MKRIIGLFVLVLAVIFGALQVRQHGVQADGTDAAIPSSYGHCVGYAHARGHDALIFQADDGTVRLLNLDNGHWVTFTRN
jgi:hypothetical protein